MSESIAAQQMGLSFIETKKSSFLWKISNCNHLERKLRQSTTKITSGWSKGQKEFIDVIVSPTFSTNPNDNLKLYLAIVSLDVSSLHPILTDPLFIFIQLRSKASRFVTVKPHIKSCMFIVKENGEKFSVTNYDYKYDLDLLFYFFPDITELLDRSKGYIKNDELQILLEYEVIPNYESNEVFTFKNHDSINRSILDTFEKQRKNQEFCDVVLVAPCGRKLWAHKFVLTAISPVFYAMLKNDMKEKQESSIKIQDITYEALEEMLRFMYCGKVEKLDQKNVGCLLSAAEKYQIIYLKDICVEFLIKNLKIENALSTLKLCKTFGSADSLAYVEAFIKPNAKFIYHNSTAKKFGDESDMYLKMVHDLADKIESLE